MLLLSYKLHRTDFVAFVLFVACVLCVAFAVFRMTEMIARRRRNNSGSEDKYFGNSRYQNLNGTTVEASATSLPPDPAKIVRDPEMSCRDRTTEFLSAVKSLQSRQTNGVAPSRQSAAVRQRSEFTQIARRIGRDLANTFAKLEKLAILAKRKSLFDDKPVEIQELTYIVKDDINSLNKQIAQLQEIARSQQGQNGRQKQNHSNSIVVSLQSKLANMSNDFKQVLEVRTENLKHQKNRREQFSQSALPPAPSQGFGHQGSSVLLQDEAKYNGSGDVAINMDQGQLQIIDQQDSYIQERADTMQTIESTIVELGQIFTQLAHMVKEQEESVQRIDSNVETSQLNIEAAHGELLKYFQSVTNNRWLMIKIFGVLIVFFIIFIVFMA